MVAAGIEVMPFHYEGLQLIVAAIRYQMPRPVDGCGINVAIAGGQSGNTFALPTNMCHKCAVDAVHPVCPRTSIQIATLQGLVSYQSWISNCSQQSIMRRCRAVQYIDLIKTAKA